MNTPDGDDMREGEVAIAADPPTDALLRFIGKIETPWRMRNECPRQGDRERGPPCRLLLDAMWVPALDGIDDQSLLRVLYWMHEARRDLVKLVPRGATPRGPFALRAPTRPNPIASSVVRLLGRDGPVLTVRGMDCVTGTPLLDLKPWREA